MTTLNDSQQQQTTFANLPALETYGTPAGGRATPKQKQRCERCQSYVRYLLKRLWQAPAKLARQQQTVREWQK